MPVHARIMSPPVPPQEVCAVIFAVAASPFDLDLASEPVLKLYIVGVLVGARLEVLPVRKEQPL